MSVPFGVVVCTEIRPIGHYGSALFDKGGAVVRGFGGVGERMREAASARSRATPVSLHQSLKLLLNPCSVIDVAAIFRHKRRMAVSETFEDPLAAIIADAERSHQIHVMQEAIA